MIYWRLVEKRDLRTSKLSGFFMFPMIEGCGTTVPIFEEDLARPRCRLRALSRSFSLKLRTLLDLIESFSKLMSSRFVLRWSRYCLAV